MCVIPKSAYYFCVCLSLATFASLTITHITATDDEPDSKIYFGHFLIISLRYENKIIIFLLYNIINHAQNNIKRYQTQWGNTETDCFAMKMI